MNANVGAAPTTPRQNTAGNRSLGWFAAVNWRFVIVVVIACMIIGWGLYYFKYRVFDDASGSGANDAGSIANVAQSMKNKARESWYNIAEVTKNVLNNKPSLVSTVVYGRFPTLELTKTATPQLVSYDGVSY